jgi:hypothetical protein
MKISTLFSAKKIIVIRRNTCKVLCIGIFLTVLFWFIVRFFSAAAGTYVRQEGLREIQISSSEYPYFTYLVDKPFAAIFNDKPLSYKTASPKTGILPYDYYTFTFLYEGRQQILFYYYPTLNEVFNITYILVEPSSDFKEALLNLAALYRQEIYKTYGALLVWDEVDKIFPMYSNATITDIYSGESFNVQRREGSTHVDAQPLTAEDSAIMKEIYGNRWSWDRKGIIVEVGEYRIAASMHGMPHGSGKIDDNNFPGHFCIHFLGSTIHSGGMDIHHHREILKAAGKLPIDDF